MKRNLAVAVLSISSLVVPQFASAGQAANYRGYNQNTYYQDGRYYRTAPSDRGWHDRGEYRNGYGEYRNDYYGGRYDDNRRYYERDNHAGRSVAIIGGSAAAGAALGAAAGHGQGAAIGAIIGGVAGVVADQAVRHHNRNHW
jgi:hypothetical protein